MKQFSAKTISNIQISDTMFELAFEWDSGASDPMPGQFVTLRVSPFSAPLLRRPFALSGMEKSRGIARIIYKRRGPATDILANTRPGDFLDVLGPLGTGFTVACNVKAICVAGGTGFGPMLYLATLIKETGGECTVVLGCRTKAQVPMLPAIDALSPIIVTDDGSMGIRGTPLTYLSALHGESLRNAVVCTCGPHPLMHGCFTWATSHGLDCYVSMEQMMACGVGACMGCVVKQASGNYARACCEGPVFAGKDVQWT